jgi:hypothetical protein
MDITKALEHFEWKLKNHWKPTQKDVDAYNQIIKFKDFHEGINLQQNELLAKLWIEKLIMLNRTKLYTTQRSIEEIDKILSTSLYDMILILQNEIPLMRFNSVGIDKYPLYEKDVLNRTKTIERNKKIVDEFETELTEALKFDIKEADLVKFIERQITRILIK